MFSCIKNKIRYLVCQRNYSKILKRIKFKEKLKVIFLVTENSKWGYQSLYESMINNPKFEPLVLVSVLNRVHKGIDKTRNNLEENYQFFKSRNMNVDYAYRNGEFVNLKEFEPDIVFYEQPWDLPKIYKPQYVSKFALTFLSPYSFQIFDFKDDYKQNFHKFLFKYLVTSDINIYRFERYNKDNSKNCLNINYLKLDEYLKDLEDNHTIWESPSKFKIIYSPHFAFSKGSIGVSTFLENGKFILNLAKELQNNTTWIFKPHPQLKYALLTNKIMTEAEVEAYYNEWEIIGKVYTQGNYFNIFKTSDLMITDCCSFLGEYLPTLNPIIRPLSPIATPLNDLGNEIVKGYYETNDNLEIKKILLKLLHNNDEKKQIRKELVNNVLKFNQNSAESIINYISELIR